MFKLVKLSVTQFKGRNNPTAGGKIKYVFENENGENRVRVLYTNVDKSVYPVNVFVGRPFIEKIMELGVAPAVHDNACFRRITYRLTYKQRG